MSINTPRNNEARRSKTDRKPGPTPVQRQVEKTAQRVHDIKNKT